MRLHGVPQVLRGAIRCIALSVAVLALPSLALANPIPGEYSVTGSISANGVLVAPGPINGTTLTITILNSSGVPIVNLPVWVVFHPTAAIRVCADAQHTAVTDQNGVCTIQLRAAGCIRNTIGACCVIAGGIEIMNYRNVKSPDNASHTESQPDGSVSVADLVFFGDEFRGMAAAGCHDYDNDDDCDVVDLTYFGDPFKAELHCTLP